MFRWYNHLQAEICMSEITLLTTDPLLWTLITVMYINSDRFLAIVDVVAVLS
jgi:hypothetical protein